MVDTQDAHESYVKFLDALQEAYGLEHTRKLLTYLLKEIRAGHIEGNRENACRADEVCGCLIGTLTDHLGTTYHWVKQDVANLWYRYDTWEEYLFNVAEGDTPKTNTILAEFVLWTKEYLAAHPVARSAARSAERSAIRSAVRQVTHVS